MADETRDGTSECLRDGAANKTLDEAWDKAEPNDTDDKHDVDWPWDIVKIPSLVSNLWPFIAFLCLGHHCDQADLALTSGPNEGTFLFPGCYSKYIIILALMWDSYLWFQILACACLEGAS